MNTSFVPSSDSKAAKCFGCGKSLFAGWKGYNFIGIRSKTDRRKNRSWCPDCNKRKKELLDKLARTE